MKRFDKDSIKQRNLKRIKGHKEWSLLIEKGTAELLFDTMAESEAEIARYLEYLFQEKKWLTARNMSSQKAMTDLLRYKLRRPVSAKGFVIISHCDLYGNDRLKNIGSLFFNLDEPSNFDDSLNKEPSSTTTFTSYERNALVPYTGEKPYFIAEGTKFFSKSGKQYFATDTVYIHNLNIPFSEIKQNPIMFKDFIKKGGWNGIKYLKVPIMEGERTSTVLGFAKGEKFESFYLNLSNVENASDVISNKYFYIEVQNPKNNFISVWKEVYAIQLAGKYDRVFEVETLADEKGLVFTFGNGITGELLEAGSKVTLYYVRTSGEDGNNENLFDIVTFQSENPYVENRVMLTTGVNGFLSCTNTTPILGGKNFINENEIKREAPLQNFTRMTHTSLEHYKEYIIANFVENIERIKLYSKSVGIKQDNDTFLVQNKIGISCINSKGQAFDKDFFETNINSLLKDVRGEMDSFEYDPPDIQHIGISASIDTDDTSINLEHTNNVIKEYIAIREGVGDRTFKTPFFLSNVLKHIKSFEYINNVQIALEVFANIDFKKASIIKANTSGKYIDSSIIIGNQAISLNMTCFKIPFSFSKSSFSNKDWKIGKNPTLLKNAFTLDEMYLRINVEFLESTYKVNNRTFILRDNRDIEIEDINSIPEDYHKLIVSNYEYEKEKRNNYKDLKVRLSQHLFNESLPVLSDTKKRFSLFIDDLKEIRPFVQNKKGENAIIPLIQIPSEKQVIMDNTVFYLDDKYLQGFQIYFNEETLDGAFYIPCSILHYEDIANKNISDLEIYNKLISSLKVSICANTIEEKIELYNDKDIIILPRENIKLETNFRDYK